MSEKISDYGHGVNIRSFAERLRRGHNAYTPYNWQAFASRISPSSHYRRAASQAFDEYNPNPLTAADEWFPQ